MAAVDAGGLVPVAPYRPPLGCFPSRLPVVAASWWRSLGAGRAGGGPGTGPVRLPGGTATAGDGLV